MQWEYLVFPFLSTGESDSDRLNKLGKEGWELVAVPQQFNTHFAYMKRPITATQVRRD